MSGTTTVNTMYHYSAEENARARLDVNKLMEDAERAKRELLEKLDANVK